MINFRMLKVSDKFIWWAVALLILTSFLMIFSTTYSAESKAGRDALFYLKRQAGAAILGLIFMSAAAYLDYRHLKVLAPWLYVLMLLLLLVGQVFGVTAQGAQRWISFGLINFQPSEVAKLILIITLATYFDIKKEKSNILPPLILAGIPFFLVFRQPDLGTALVIIAISLGMLIWSRTSPLLLTMIITPVLSLFFRQNLYLWVFYLLALWLVLYFTRIKLLDMVLILGINIGVGLAFPILWGSLKEYQRLRILAFLNPGADPHGVGYHTLQSQIAIGAGGLFGRGFMHGTQTQLQFIPIQHSDFIFSAIGEELGFIGSIFTLFLLLSIVWRTFQLADESRDFLGGALAVGIAAMLGFHIFTNIGMTLGLLPVVGIPLPFVSYGGTSLLISMTAIGILQSIAMRRQKLIF